MRTDDPDVIDIEGPPPLRHPAEVVIEALSPVVTPGRLERIRQVVAQRTEDIVVVLDSITDPHTASAVLRSADAFGVQTVHTIVGAEGFKTSRGVSKGTHRWLDVVHHEQAASCARKLREDDYRIYVAAMGGEHDLASLRREPRVALVFGNEHRGVSTEMSARADGTFSIAMRGFVESLNVSVAAAISIQALTEGGRTPLSAEKQRILQARFLMSSVHDADGVIERFVRE